MNNAHTLIPNGKEMHQTILLVVSLDGGVIHNFDFLSLQISTVAKIPGINMYYLHKGKL